MLAKKYLVEYRWRCLNDMQTEGAVSCARGDEGCATHSTAEPRAERDLGRAVPARECESPEENRCHEAGARLFLFF